MNSRGVYGLHILPDETVSDKQHKYIKSFVEKACKTMESYASVHLPKKESIVVGMNVGPNAYLTIYKHSDLSIFAGICFTEKKNNKISYHVSQVCDAGLLRGVLLRDIDYFAKRCKTHLENYGSSEYTCFVPEEMVAAWRRCILSLKSDKEYDYIEYDSKAKETNDWKEFD